MVTTPSKREVTVHEAAQLLEVSPDTIRRWEKKGLIKARRSIDNYRLFDLEDLQEAHAKYCGGANDEPYVIHVGKKTRFNVIELFSGAGGLALGLENAGLNTLLLVECDKDAVATLRQNRPKWRMVAGDVATVKFRPYRDRCDIVAGGFPCQAFSYAGAGRGFGDTRGTLFFEFARCVKEVRPKIALAENVRGLVEHDRGRTLSTMVKILDDLGYAVSYRLLRAQFLDVPQKRERLFIIGVRKNLGGVAFFPKESNSTVSLRAALANCPPSRGMLYTERKRRVMELVPEGGYWRDLPVEIQKEYMGASYYHSGGRPGMARRMAWDEPTLTLTCNPAQMQTERCHPTETRPLNCREYARIQTFPDDWGFTGSVASQYRQIGNAVPVNLGFHVGRCLIAMLKKKFDPATMVQGTWVPGLRPQQWELPLDLG